MKSTYIAFALLIAAVVANPIFQSEDVGEEFAPASVKEEDWQLVPDSDGYMHLVDINSFDMEAEPAFNAPTDVIFRLWTRQNPTAGQIIQMGNNAQLDASNFSPARQTRFHCHGWNGGGPNTGVAVRSALIQQQDVNVMVVDWGAGAQTPNYIAARNRVNDVGAVVASCANWLNSRGVPFANMGFIGHSLGAHIVGAAGKRTSSQPASIVGLDPAGPLFSLDDPANRLHHTDAVYTECIVTDAGRLGFEHPVCDGNFYPNWGRNQPGCGTDITGNCAHGRSSEFYAASVDHSNHFVSTRCAGGIDNIRGGICPSGGPNGRLGGDPANNSGQLSISTVFFLPTTDAHPFVMN